MFATILILTAMAFATLAIVMHDHLESHDRAQAMIARTITMRRLHNAMRVNPPRTNPRNVSFKANAYDTKARKLEAYNDAHTHEGAEDIPIYVAHYVDVEHHVGQPV